MPNGTTYTDRGHLAGNTTIVIKPDGTAVMHGKFNQPWQDTMQLIGAIAVAKSGENVAEAAITSTKVRGLAATRASVARAREATTLEQLRLANDLEKFRILHPATLPVTP
jgi:lipoate-protein ligase A